LKASRKGKEVWERMKVANHAYRGPVLLVGIVVQSLQGRGDSKKETLRKKRSDHKEPLENRILPIMRF